MEVLVIEEDVVDIQVFLQDLTHCLRSVFPHP